MGQAPYLTVATVIKSHGLSGELSVRFLDRVDELPVDTEVWFTPPSDGPSHGYVTAIRQGPKGPLLSVDSIRDRDAADALRGREVRVLTSAAPDHWKSDDADSIIGYVVTDVARGFLGQVGSVIVTGANDVWTLEGGPFGEVLIPVIDDVIIDMDDENRECTVRLLPGLIED